MTMDIRILTPEQAEGYEPASRSSSTAGKRRTEVLDALERGAEVFIGARTPLQLTRYYGLARERGFEVSMEKSYDTNGAEGTMLRRRVEEPTDGDD